MLASRVRMASIQKVENNGDGDYLFDFGSVIVDYPQMIILGEKVVKLADFFTFGDVYVEFNLKENNTMVPKYFSVSIVKDYKEWHEQRIWFHDEDITDSNSNAILKRSQFNNYGEGELTPMIRTSTSLIGHRINFEIIFKQNNANGNILGIWSIDLEA